MNEKTRTLALFLPLLGSIILLAGLLTLFAAPPAAAGATIRYVAPGGDCGGASPCYATIQAAVDAAENGDEIRIAEGTYTGVSTHSGKTALVYIKRPEHLTLRGGYTSADWEHPDPDAHPTVLDAQGQGMVIYVRAVTAFIEGFHITGGYASEAVSGEESGAGIHSTFGDWVAIQNCEVYSNTNDGIYLEFGDGATIQDNRVHDNIGHGIGLFTSNYPTISHNQVANNSASGIYVNSAWDQLLGRPAHIQDNAVTGNGRGFYLSSVLGGDISGNQILSNTVGADFYNTAGGGMMIEFSGLDIHDNEIRGNHSKWGGGIYINGCHDTVIENNHIEDNHADLTWDSEGGGLYIETSGDVTITNNTILSNTGGLGAGGAYVLSSDIAPEDILIQGNTFSGNQGDRGGGLDVNTGTVANNRFLDNQARLGGGLYTQPYSLTLRSNLFQGNQAGEDGGGICIYFGSAVWMEGNRLIGNQAGGNGGGLRSFFQYPSLDATLLMTNTLAVDNAAAHGSGLYVYGGWASLKHTTLAHNGVAGSGDGVGLYVKPFGVGVVSATLTNTIVASQTVGVYAEPNAPVSLVATLWGGGDWANGADWGGGGQIVTGTLNYWGDPLFVDPAHGDYHISADSPARDKGVDVGVTTDMDGESRPHPDTGVPDIGADEYHLDDIHIYLPLVMTSH